MPNPTPIHSRVKLEKAYGLLLKREVLDPLFVDLRSGLSQVAALDKAYREMENAAQESMRRIREQTTSNGLLRGEIDQHFAKVSQYHHGRLFQSFRAALGVDVTPILNEDYIRHFLNETVERNVDLIKTIPPRMHTSLKRRFQKEFLEAPFDAQRVSGLLQKEYGSTGYNLRRLTRDQTQKTVSKLTEVRHQQLGLEGYIWRTSGDERVRETHAANEGDYYRWNNPPEVTGHPGEDVQCRCTAEPVIRKKDRERLKQETKAAMPAPDKAGLTRPKPGTATGRVWDVADDITRQQGRLAERKEVVARIVQEGGNQSTAATQYQKWKKFHGGMVPPQPPVVAPPSIAPAAIPQPVLPSVGGELVEEIGFGSGLKGRNAAKKWLRDKQEELARLEQQDWNRHHRTISSMSHVVERKITARYEAAVQEFHDKLFEGLTPGKIGGKMYDLSTAQRVEYNDAKRFVANLIGEEQSLTSFTARVDNAYIARHGNPLGLANQYSGRLTFSSKTRARTMVHEMMHLVEAWDKRNLEAAVKWYDKYTAGDVLIQTKKYAHGAGRKDKLSGWHAQYAGSKPFSATGIRTKTSVKSARDGWVRGTEVTTRAADMLYSQPFQMLENNEHLFDFIYDHYIRNRKRKAVTKIVPTRPAVVAPKPVAPQQPIAAAQSQSTSTFVAPKVGRPKSGATARVWEIADEVSREKGRLAERREVVSRIVAEGGNRSTAGTQYGKWKKAASEIDKPRTNWPISDEVTRVRSINNTTTSADEIDNWLRGLSPSQQTAIEDYLGNSNAINNALREGETSGLYIDQAKRIREALRKSKGQRPDVVWRVYEEANDVPFKIDNMKPGTQFRSPGFNSATANPEGLAQFEEHLDLAGREATKRVFEIKPKTGRFVVSRDKVYDEYLIEDNAEFLLIGKKTVKMKRADGGVIERVVYQLEEV